MFDVFYVPGSVYLGNVYVRLKVQLDVHVFICILYSSIFLALYVSGAICTHPQEHKLQRTAIGVCNGFGMLIHWSRYWLGPGPRGGAVVEALRYKLEGRGNDSRLCHWNFSLP
jgi:hypothetical protein